MKMLWVVAALLVGAGAKRTAAPPKDLWDFDNLTARVSANGETSDELTTLALTQLGIRLEGSFAFQVSAHNNTVGGVTLHLEDPSDPKVACALYATREGEGLSFKDSRCSFPIFKDRQRTVATCRRISGTARRVSDRILLEATAPDCTAAPMGFPLLVRASVRPL